MFLARAKLIHLLPPLDCMKIQIIVASSFANHTLSFTLFMRIHLLIVICSKSHPSRKLWRVKSFAEFWFSHALNTSCLPLFTQNTTNIQLFNWQVSIRMPFIVKLIFLPVNGKQWQQQLVRGGGCQFKCCGVVRAEWYVFSSITVHCRDEPVVGNERISNRTSEIDTHNINQESEANGMYYFRLSACTKMICLQLTMRELGTWKRRQSKRERGPHSYCTIFQIRWNYFGLTLDLSSFGVFDLCYGTYKPCRVVLTIALIQFDFIY